MFIFNLCLKILIECLELQLETDCGAVQVQEQTGFSVALSIFCFPFPEIISYLYSGIATFL